mgnify:CR=1 FL=1
MVNIGYYLGFSHFLGIGPVRFQALLNRFSSVKDAYLADQSQLREILGENLAKKFIEFRKQFDWEKKVLELEKKKIKIVTQEDKQYPVGLKNINDPPICFYLKGELPASTKIFLAIVGTRKATDYGLKTAFNLALALAEAGLIIVSGMALGIDTQAHWGALQAGEKTVAVLGCGVDIVYPAANRPLYQKILSCGGGIISEFPPGQLVQKGLFIARNRIISGLAKAVLVVEGAEDSGALITARYAAEQGKEVLAVPGPISSAVSAAPNNLIKQGARLVTSVDDIFEALDLKIKPKKQETVLNQLTKEEKDIFSLLVEGPKSVDDLFQETKKPVAEILKIVSLLEIKQLIRKNPQGSYESF